MRAITKSANKCVRRIGRFIIFVRQTFSAPRTDATSRPVFTPFYLVPSAMAAKKKAVKKPAKKAPAKKVIKKKPVRTPATHSDAQKFAWIGWLVEVFCWPQARL